MSAVGLLKPKQLGATFMGGGEIFQVVVLPRSVEALEDFVQHKICMAGRTFFAFTKYIN